MIWAGHLDWITARFFIPGTKPSGPPPASLGEWQAWVAAEGGYDYAACVVRVTLVAHSPSTILIGVPVITTTRSSAPEGNIVARYVGGASVNPLGFDVHLGEGSTWTSTSDNDGYVKDPLSWSLAEGETQQFLLRVAAEQPGLWRWRAEIPVMADGKRTMHAVTNRGKDFEIIGGGDGEELIWHADEWRPHSDVY